MANTKVLSLGHYNHLHRTMTLPNGQTLELSGLGEGFRVYDGGPLTPEAEKGLWRTRDDSFDELDRSLGGVLAKAMSNSLLCTCQKFNQVEQKTLELYHSNKVKLKQTRCWKDLLTGYHFDDPKRNLEICLTAKFEGLNFHSKIDFDKKIAVLGLMAKLDILDEIREGLLRSGAFGARYNEQLLLMQRSEEKSCEFDGKKLSYTDWLIAHYEQARKQGV